jgi:hypothetical protein
MSSGGRLSSIYVTNDHEVNVNFVLSHCD